MEQNLMITKHNERNLFDESIYSDKHLRLVFNKKEAHTYTYIIQKKKLENFWERD